MHDEAKKAKVGIQARANIGLAAAQGETSGAIGRISGEVFEGGTHQYVKEEGYKKQYGSMLVDGAIGRAQAQLGVAGDLRIPMPEGQQESAAVANLGLLRKQRGKRKLLHHLGLAKNDLKSAPRAEKKADDQQSLLKAQLMAELKLDVQLQPSSKKQERTMVEGRTKAAQVSADADLILGLGTDRTKSAVSATSKVTLTKTDKAYVKYTPIWEALRHDKSAKTAEASPADKQTITLLSIGFAKSNLNLFPKGTDINNASPKLLLAALNNLQSDVTNYAGSKHILDREVQNPTMSKLIKRQIKSLNTDYAAHSIGPRSTDRAAQFASNVALIHAAIGMRLEALEQSGHADAKGSSEILSAVNQTILEKMAPYQSDKSMGFTHISSTAKIRSKSTEEKIKVALPGGSAAMVKVSKTVTTAHPDSLRKEDSLTLTIGLPPGATP